jgi:hypothetical protein
MYIRKRPYSGNDTLHWLYRKFPTRINRIRNLKNAVFWDVTPCGSCKNRHFEETYHPIIRVTRIGELGTTLAVTCKKDMIFPCSEFRLLVHRRENLILI